MHEYSIQALTIKSYLHYPALPRAIKLPEDFVFSKHLRDTISKLVPGIKHFLLRDQLVLEMAVSADLSQPVSECAPVLKSHTISFKTKSETWSFLSNFWPSISVALVVSVDRSSLSFTIDHTLWYFCSFLRSHSLHSLFPLILAGSAVLCRYMLACGAHIMTCALCLLFAPASIQVLGLVPCHLFWCLLQECWPGGINSKQKLVIKCGLGWTFSWLADL